VKKRVLFFRTTVGKCPIEEFLDSLEGKITQKVTWVIKLIEELDEILKTYLKKISGTRDIWEVRTNLAVIHIAFYLF